MGFGAVLVVPFTPGSPAGLGGSSSFSFLASASLRWVGFAVVAGGVGEGPHVDGRVRLVGLGRQVFGGRTGGGGDRLVGVEPLSIFTDPVRSSGTCCSGLASLTRSSS